MHFLIRPGSLVRAIFTPLCGAENLLQGKKGHIMRCIKAVSNFFSVQIEVIFKKKQQKNSSSFDKKMVSALSHLILMHPPHPIF